MAVRLVSTQYCAVIQLARSMRCAAMRCDVHLAGSHVRPSLEFSVSHDGRVGESIGWMWVGVSDNVVVGGRKKESGGCDQVRYANGKEQRGEDSSGSCVFILFLVDVFQNSKLTAIHKGPIRPTPARASLSARDFNHPKDGNRPYFLDQSSSSHDLRLKPTKARDDAREHTGDVDLVTESIAPSSYRIPVYWTTERLSTSATTQKIVSPTPWMESL